MSKEMRFTGSHVGATVKRAEREGRKKGGGLKVGFGWTEPPDKGRLELALRA